MTIETFRPSQPFLSIRKLRKYHHLPSFNPFYSFVKIVIIPFFSVATLATAGKMLTIVDIGGALSLFNLRFFQVLPAKMLSFDKFQGASSLLLRLQPRRLLSPFVASLRNLGLFGAF